MKRLHEIESVGWGFFGIVFAFYAGPGVYIAFLFTYDTMTIPARAFLGVVLAVLASGVTAWAVNDVLHRRNLRRLAGEKKSERKERRRKGRK